MQAITQSLSDGIGAILSALPALIGAILILVIGYIIAKVLQGITTKVLQSMGFEGWMESGGIKQFFERSQTNQSPLSILGKLVFWLVFFVAITMAVDTLGISALSDVLAQFIAYIPQIIAAILILVLATLLANFVAGIVRGATGSGVVGSIAQYGIIVFAVFAALTQLGIAPELIAPTFLILLGAVALAAALAFGLGAQGTAREIIQGAYSRRGELRAKSSSRTSEGNHSSGSSSGSSSKSSTADSRSSSGGSRAGGVVAVEDRLDGYQVYDRHYEKIGKVDDLLVDENDEPEYIGIKMGFLGTRTTLIPAEVARVNDRRSLVEIAAEKEHIKEGPTFDGGNEITPELEQQTHRHYDIERASGYPAGDGFNAYYAGTTGDGTVDLQPGERAGGDVQEVERGQTRKGDEERVRVHKRIRRA